MIDEAMIRTLLKEQLPHLADLPLERFQGGWDNQMWRLGDELAVRFPMTPRAPLLLEQEHRWLPVLAPRLPLPVPAPVRLGEPTGAFPKPWLVTSWVPGSPADSAPVEDGPRSAAALAAFLTALHREAPADAPRNPHRSMPIHQHPDMDLHSGGFLSAEQIPALQAIWDDAVAAEPWHRPPVWIHADLHPANVLTAGGTLAGVIDFGDMCAADPAADLCAAWMLLPENAIAAFLDAHPLADAATVRRARGWALMRAFGLMQVGRAGELGQTGGKPTWTAGGRATIDRLLAGR
ncbi:Predicted kinase, aminoglycoside phosphotransferase (APT) family [Glycomyces harbinensis]|uniref:Predicted kinase, aminoglycoside phosphotransferase (APT) family n=2 Tax=Glycomyces harbinensis TaxID=58114 RepID=A0A1G6U909_9ACTN|nr:Predicted kinase, aminoglycoside phosphotransferase (APT) family [Glycomyces harbinensis]